MPVAELTSAALCADHSPFELWSGWFRSSRPPRLHSLSAFGGDWNADYRLSWVRYTSLVLGILARLGKECDGARFLNWLAQRGSSTQAPLQTVYGVEGETDFEHHQRTDLSGYRNSQPVRFGNHAYKQHQHDNLGYLADCILLHLEQEIGDWRPEYWDLVCRSADYVMRRPANSPATVFGNCLLSSTI